MRIADRTGTVLLEVIVALTILTAAGIGIAAAVGQAVQTVHRARAAEAELREASSFLDAVSLWDRADLDRRLGSRPQGPWRLHVQRPSETLYLLVLSDSVGSREILRTAVFREPPADR